MPEIPSLASLDGRRIYRELYHRLRFEQQRGTLTTLKILHQIAVGSRSLQEFELSDTTVRHKLGWLSGTRLWLEEIVSRYYYSTVLSFVYGGAAVLLVVIGLRRFSTFISDGIVLLSVGLEAMLLLLLFTVMFFGPSEEKDPQRDEITELLREIGEIGRDYAIALKQLERTTAGIQQLAHQTEHLARATEKAANAAAAATSPTPELIEHLRSVNSALIELHSRLETLAQALRTIEHNRIEDAVRTHLTQLLENRLSDHSQSNPSQF